MSDYYDLGKHTRTISTSSADAQMWFDRGLNWTYGFNHEEAMRCFEFAIEADPDCPMAHWGLAYAAGPNTQVYGFVQLPVYTYVNGVQLTTGTNISVGISQRF